MPHLTVGWVATDDELHAVEARAHDELGPARPPAFRVGALTLLAELDDGTWAETARIPLGAA